MNIDKILNLTPNELNNLDTTYISNYDLYHNINYFHGEAGKEHYRLLMYISKLFNNDIIFDIGTNKCMSAIALSYNKKNTIKSFDIVRILPVNPTIENIEFILSDSTLDKDMLSTPFIFLDVDHDGLYENKIYNFLKSINWKGILMLDDIHLNEPMKLFWNQIEFKKHDITHLGHWSGTGIVEFGILTDK